MPTVVSTPVVTYVAAIMTGQGVKYSTSITATVSFAGWEAKVAIWSRFSAVSQDAVVNFYPSPDNGLTYDTAPMYSVSVPRVLASTSQASIRIPAGQYAIEIKNNAHQSASFAIQTVELLTAIQNV